VQLMTHQPMKPPTVVKLTNQPKTVAAPLEAVMKAKRENKDYPYTRSVDGPSFPSKKRLTQKATETSGRPAFVTRLKIAGA